MILTLTGNYSALHDYFTQNGLNPWPVENEGEEWRFGFTTQEEFDAANDLLVGYNSKKMNDIKQSIRTAINAERDRREQGGFDYAGKRFDSDATSVIRINAAVNTAVAAVLAESEFSVGWTAADNTTVTLTAQEFLEFSAALAQHSNTQHVRARALKEQLDNADTAEAVAEVENLLEAWKTEA
ncbi:DUF4376 domain-containing protein [Sporomusa sphaeroides DSM 2875]|uniref:DUF4376 domain-containing protein n=1 Tax=Sporomusa sphaeroides TaxID=47679 RepID=UPI00202FFD2C|nr:DUF4376 domain-containing protein [Sporomusa sphaeroides]MCM0759620.1 DUF4376 domain-containing protein [Sporomusa sphaeroides DSM 2875]